MMHLRSIKHESYYYNIIINIMVGLTVLFLFISCSDAPNKNANNSSGNITGDSLTDKNAQYYEIEKQESDNTKASLFVYVLDTAKIKDINKFLKAKHNEQGKKFLDIYYFNKKGIGKNYLDKQFDDKVSDKEKEALFKHFIAIYRYNPSTGYDQLNYEH